MVRRIILIGVVLCAAILFSMGDVAAGRLGGAYRGPYEDIQQENQDQESEVDSSGGSENRGSGEAEQGGEGGDTTQQPPGEEPPPSGDDDDTGDDDDDAPTSAGGESGSKDPGSAGGFGGGGGIAPPGGGGGGDAGTVVEDVEAFWPFFFEYNKEWMLELKLRERGSRAPLSENSSVWWFRWASGQKSSSPVTKDQKRKIILPLLLENLQSRSVWTRDAAVLALGKLGGQGTVPAISGRLADKELDIREDALLSLGLTGQEEAAEPLRRTLKGSNLDLKAYAALGLALLGRKDADTISLILNEYKALIRRPDDKSEQVAACLAVSLGMLGDAENEDLIDALAAPMGRRKGYELLKVYICQALGRIGGEDCRDWLSRAMNDKSKEVKAAAILALSDHPDKRVIRDLKKVKSGHRMSKLYSIMALGKIGASLPRNDLARKQIAADLSKITVKPQKDKYAAMYGAIALALMGDDSANKFFAENLTADRADVFKHEVHSAMAMALGILGDRRAMADIREIVGKGRLESDYRGYAAFALGILGDTGFKEELKKEMMDDDRRELLRSGCWAIGLLGDASDVPFLIEILKSSGKGKHQVRGAAVLAIGLIGDGSAVDPLVKIVREDPNSENRAFAIAALGCLVDRQPLPRIPGLFKNIHYRRDFGIMKEVLNNL